MEIVANQRCNNRSLSQDDRIPLVKLRLSPIQQTSVNTPPCQHSSPTQQTSVNIPPTQ